MEIVKYPHPALSWKSQPIGRIDAELRDIVSRMFELMYAARGIGLAANQVAIPWRFFIMNPTGDPEQKDAEAVLINPEIISRTGSEEAEEGCLSIPEVFGDVRRAEKIVVDAFDLDGNDIRYELSELAARVVLHETDHLDGIMFPDRMSETGRREIEPRLQDFEDHFRRQQQTGVIASDAELRAELQRLQQLQQVSG